MSSSFKLVIF